MEKIASFCIDHNKLLPGIYISRIDGDIVTYDIRMRKPNVPPFLPNAAMHTIEHLFATFARNGEYREQVIYFGPMGCRTGFYFLVRNMDYKEAIRLIKDAFAFIADFEGAIPGATAKECGNYLEHDLEGARKEAREFLPKIEGWNEEKLRYLS
ncbi:S-ribosylhomocysteine lyase [Caproiciproducens galactitolivorans]|uniref:S-ribosylhomocysteine lyase n=1 Tax=Caproiciproducens galactitolivorans TaxID=642589 RepID=A0ABT4BW00_9FIRM|nr:S-ribosylhomocysteine lyase [Caproiciproducens galactitolivorans]MCY1714248.1 S-ribosylhomocysteine lyase [Caproiciproducens galactitolivorans]